MWLDEYEDNPMYTKLDDATFLLVIQAEYGHNGPARTPLDKTGHPIKFKLIYLGEDTITVHLAYSTQTALLSLPLSDPARSSKQAGEETKWILVPINESISETITVAATSLMMSGPISLHGPGEDSLKRTFQHIATPGWSKEADWASIQAACSVESSHLNSLNSNTKFHKWKKDGWRHGATRGMLAFPGSVHTTLILQDPSRKQAGGSGDVSEEGLSIVKTVTVEMIWYLWDVCGAKKKSRVQKLCKVVSNMVD